ncbi:MarR family transcriptional regulator [Achromobacter denitrificans]|jgi:DNA-binding MarR family transcriptional regulator/GNAT superfamily N-acetyltransferase|uniref:MarR family transcriptional regulator n=2 Tax=Achromobacter denitrificans TaxID=32002 RepID=A0A3R9FJW0_ACHDE|nr:MULTISPECIES: helix-turn-helix domain-containing GNAT family N-acetyltransferase [Achromobacter]ASC65857.1 MarR family transcriptional regulator [Achromobacter denitrificans]MBV2161684.1 helix-turn-helix domain-containing GNAT family N-acetyltransferase [Achromobacter denitrificans]MDF3852210.1 helix-turn-helix domain-containing GNAT family N-acetyltransferase [Achromobacter denitrificans]MDF3860237.1 helix-turn-helix domain-containing GNAT family N-acetyltransferase [Achromobacter denitrifi
MDLIDIPSQSRDKTIQDLREFSRKLVRELGFMRSSLAGSELAPSAVHAIIEIGLQPGIQARDLAAILRLDKSNTSRQVAKLESAGLVTRETDTDDARASRLYLSAAGRDLRGRIDQFATDQVSRALRQLAPADQQSLIRFLSLYADALSKENPNTAQAPGSGGIESQIREGYAPGCIGDVASLHARYYAQASGFGVYFERKVATELAAFAEGLPAAGKNLWLYVDGARTLASIVIDGDLDARQAHLRWFIVDESLRGMGVGRALLERALAFADAHYDETYLWTFKGLDAARHLYESAGFGLTDESEGRQWGSVVTEQRFLRRAPGAAGPR